MFAEDEAVELIERAIVNSSKSRDTVLDVFGGSGSTVIACEKIARVIELVPHYVDTTVVRWQDFTGQEAVLEGDERTFKYHGRIWVESEPGRGSEFRFTLPV